MDFTPPLCRPDGSGDHQQRGGKLCVSVGAAVRQRLANRHRHRPERDGLRHPGAGQEADRQSERSEVDWESGVLACLESDVLIVVVDDDSGVLPGHHHHLRRVGVGVRDSECLGQSWRGGALQVSGSNQEVTSGPVLLLLLLLSGSRYNCFFRGADPWLQSGGAMATGLTSSSPDRSEPRYPLNNHSLRRQGPSTCSRLFSSCFCRGPSADWTRPAPSRRP